MNAMHDWFRGRLTPYLAGILPPEEEQRLEAHAAECPECRTRLELGRASLPEWAAQATHVPAAALVAYAEDPEDLLPLEREWVAVHLGRCEECSADLAELRGADAGSPPATAAGSPGAGAPGRGVAIGLRHRGRDMMLGALVGALAAAAGFVFVLRPPGRGTAPDDARSRPVPGARIPATAPPREAAGTAAATSAIPGRDRRSMTAGATLGALRPARTLTAPQRGAGAETLRVEPTAGGRLLPLRLPALFVEPATRLEVTFAGPDGRVLARDDVRYREVLPPGALVVDLGGVAPGVYQLRIATAGTGGQPPRVFYLEVLPAGR